MKKIFFSIYSIVILITVISLPIFAPEAFSGVGFWSLLFIFILVSFIFYNIKCGNFVLAFFLQSLIILAFDRLGIEGTTSDAILVFLVWAPWIGMFFSQKKQGKSHTQADSTKYHGLAGDCGVSD